MTMEYQIHLPDYLAKCINKDKPQLQCNGQCVLMKKIREKEKEEAKKNLVVYEYNNLYVHKECTKIPTQVQADETEKAYFTPYLTNYAFTYITPIFHPPVA